MHPDDSRGWLVRDAALATLSRYPEALVAFDRCLALAPRNEQAAALRARALARLPG